MRPPLIVGGEEQAGRGHVLLVLGSSPREEGAESKYAPSRRLYAFALVSSGEPWKASDGSVLCTVAPSAWLWIWESQQSPPCLPVRITWVPSKALMPTSLHPRDAHELAWAVALGIWVFKNSQVILM